VEVKGLGFQTLQEYSRAEKKGPETKQTDTKEIKVGNCKSMTLLKRILIKTGEISHIKTHQ